MDSLLSPGGDKSDMGLVGVVLDDGGNGRGCDCGGDCVSGASGAGTGSSVGGSDVDDDMPCRAANVAIVVSAVAADAAGGDGITTAADVDGSSSVIIDRATVM